jgi:hypothetical protein
MDNIAASENLDPVARQLMEWNNPFALCASSAGRYSKDEIHIKGFRGNVIESPRVAPYAPDHILHDVYAFETLEDAVRLQMNVLRGVVEGAAPMKVRDVVEIDGQKFDVSTPQGLADYIYKKAARNLGVEG